MGASQSKDELLYQQVNYGNVEGIKALRRDGAGLEYVDNEGKTPLILACLRPDLLRVAELLIEFGANVNAYRPGSHGGTPLHHAAKKGLEQTVGLLLARGANPLVVNDDCETALDMARAKGHTGVVRLIESYICLFSGWVRELYGPSFLEALAPQWVSRKIWAVVLPCHLRNSRNPLKFDLAIYPDVQIAQPRAIVPLWKAHIEEPNFNQADPAIVIVDKATKSRYKFLASQEGDKQQLQWFYNACRGIAPNITPHPPASVGVPLPNSHTSTTSQVVSAPAQEDVELAMAINASIHSAMAEGVPHLSDVQSDTLNSNTNDWGSSGVNTSYNGWGPSEVPLPSKNSLAQPQAPVTGSYNGWAASEAGQTEGGSQLHQIQPNNPTSALSVQEVATVTSTPSAPPITDTEFYDGPIQYPSIDSSPVDLSVPPPEIQHGSSEVKDGSDGLCVICLDARVEGACIPCGHMAGCMSCLKDIKAKKWGCPVCRAKIDQVIRIYAV